MCKTVIMSVQLLRLGTIVSGHSASRVSTNVFGHKRLWAQTCLGTNVCGHSRVATVVWAQSCGHKRGGTAVDSIFYFFRLFTWIF